MLCNITNCVKTMLCGVEMLYVKTMICVVAMNSPKITLFFIRPVVDVIQSVGPVHMETNLIFLFLYLRFNVIELLLIIFSQV